MSGIVGGVAGKDEVIEVSKKIKHQLRPSIPRASLAANSSNLELKWNDFFCVFVLSVNLLPTLGLSTSKILADLKSNWFNWKLVKTIRIEKID